MARRKGKGKKKGGNSRKGNNRGGNRGGGNNRGGGGGGGGGKKPCTFWAQGRCNRGSSCKYSHAGPRGGGGGGGNNNNNNRFGNNNGGGNNRFNSGGGGGFGNNRFGNNNNGGGFGNNNGGGFGGGGNNRFGGGGGGGGFNNGFKPKVANMGNGGGGGGGGFQNRFAKGKGKGKGKKKGVCRFWKQGKCRNAQGCQYAHTGQGGLDPSVGGNRFSGGAKPKTRDPFGKGGGGGGFNSGGFNSGGGGGGGGSMGMGMGGSPNRTPNRPLGSQSAYAAKLLSDIKKDLEEDAKFVHFWALSCFGPVGGEPNVYCGDIQFEELRWEAYQMDPAMYVQKEMELNQEMAGKRDAIARDPFAFEQEAWDSIKGFESVFPHPGDREDPAGGAGGGKTGFNLGGKKGKSKFGGAGLGGKKGFGKFSGAGKAQASSSQAQASGGGGGGGVGLSEEDVKAYQAKAFVLGGIPEIAPPMR